MNTISLQHPTNSTIFGNGDFHVEIYTDGSSHGNPGPSGWAFVAVLLDTAGTFIASHEHWEAVSSISTNNRAELEAALGALAFVKEYQSSGI